MNYINRFIYFLILLIPISVNGQSSGNYISFHLQNQTYQNSKLITIESDYYFDMEIGELVVYSGVPKEHVKISNRLGEVKLYYPKENNVLLKQNQYFSSENDLVYYFLSNNFYDLGLKNEGFSVSDTRIEDNYQVVTWATPAALQLVAKVELVFEQNRPVYAAYFNINNNIIRKIYYYNYEVFNNFMLPAKVTRISYLSEGDSIIQRNTYSNIKVTNYPSSDFFNYKIPEDAKVVE